MPIVPATPENLQRAASLLCEGACVALPTETVYGLAADATSVAACQKIFIAKERPFSDPLIVHVSGVEQAKRLARWNPRAEKLAAKYWPGPLTLVLPKLSLIPDLVTADCPTVALRCPAHPVFHEVLLLSGLPLAAPSANRFSRVSPTTAQAVAEELGERIPLIIDAGRCEIGIESTIVNLSDDQPRILRPGFVTREELEATLGETLARASSTSKPCETPTPGNFKVHYSPLTALVLFKGAPPREAQARIYFYKPSAQPPDYSLSEDGSLESAAARLYELFRELDRHNYTLAAIEEVPEEGLGAALGDRIRRACGRRSA